MSAEPIEMQIKLMRYFTGAGTGPGLLRAVTGSAGLRLAGMGLVFLVGVQLARGLGAEGYGTYGLAMSIIAMLMVPTEFGLPQLLTREVATAHARQDWGTIKGVLRWATRVSILMAVITAASVIAWLSFSGEALMSQLSMTLMAGVAMIPVVAQVSMRAAALRGLQEIVKGEFPDVFLRPFFYALLLFAVPLLIVPLTPSIAMALGAVSAVLALLVAERVLHDALPKAVEQAVAVTSVRAWWLSTLPMAATNGLGVLRGNLLVLVIGAMVTIGDVGNYRIATSIIGIVLFPVSILNTVAAPYIASLHTVKNTDALKKLLFTVSVGSALGILLLSIPFFVAGDWLIAYVFGEEFVPANMVVLILCTGLFLSNLFGGNVVLLNMTGHHRDVMLISAFSLVLLAAAAYFLIDRFALTGAAAAFVISNISSDFLMWVVAKKRLGMGASIFLFSSLSKAKVVH